MILTPKAKPVRIRITSNGKDNSTLEELKQNFCIADVIPLIEDKRLSRWLLQIGEKDLAEKIGSMSLSNNDILKAVQVLSLFFEDVREATSIVDLIDNENVLSKHLSEVVKNEICFLICNKGDKNLLETAILQTYKDNRNILDFCENYAYISSGDEVYLLCSLIDDTCENVKSFLLNLAAKRGSAEAMSLKNKDKFLIKAIEKVREGHFAYSDYSSLCKTSYDKRALNLIKSIYNRYQRGEGYKIVYQGDSNVNNDLDAIWHYLHIVDNERIFDYIPKVALNDFYYIKIAHPKIASMIDYYLDDTCKWFFRVDGINRLLSLSSVYRDCALISDTLSGKYNKTTNNDIIFKIALDYLQQKIENRLE